MKLIMTPKKEAVGHSSFIMLGDIQILITAPDLDSLARVFEHLGASFDSEKSTTTKTKKI